jgi:two-component system, sensor histidine kinase and response regulator
MTRVLLVEDTPDILASICLELEMNGYEVDQALDGQHALDILDKTDTLPDIIVSDIAMPNMNGYELLAICQKHTEWNGIPFIFLTALGERNHITLGKKLGVDDYLVKPFQGDELIVAITSKLRRVEQLKANANQKLDKTRRELLTLISHELRTPLAAIYGGAEMLEDSLANVPDPMSHRMLELVQSGAKRMRRLVEQIVFLTQVDSGGLAQSLEKTTGEYDMNIITNRAYTLLQEEWTPDIPAVTFNFHFPSYPIMVRSNPDFLVMMVGEGIRNAVTFTPKNGEVDIELTTDDQYVFVTVTDHGPGISAENLPRIWDRFVQINRSRTEQQGMGLGLSLTRESARLHHGDCKVESVVGQGTQFILYLPLATT